MAIEILTDSKTFQSVMYCNIAEIAFGPVFGPDEDPQNFLDWLEENKSVFYNIGISILDIRLMSEEEMGELVDRWRKQKSQNIKKEQAL